MLTEIKIEGMSCGHCVKAVEKALSKIPVEIKKVKIGTAEVEYDETKIKRDTILNVIELEGYKAM